MLRSRCHEKRWRGELGWERVFIVTTDGLQAMLRGKRSLAFVSNPNDADILHRNDYSSDCAVDSCFILLLLSE